MSFWPFSPLHSHPYPRILKMTPFMRSPETFCAQLMAPDESFTQLRPLFALQLEPSTPGGFVKVGGSVQLRPPPPLPHREPHPPTSDPLSTGPSDPSTQLMEALRWDEEGLPFSAILEEKIEETGELRIDAEVKDSGMMLMNAVSPQLEWIQGTANIVLAVSGLLLLLSNEGGFREAHGESRVRCVEHVAYIERSGFKERRNSGLR
jgi:hypothetical protein